jgi:hypothetical protein
MRWIAVKKSEKVWPKKSATAEKKSAKNFDHNIGPCSRPALTI